VDDIEKALAIIEDGRASHQWYVDHPTYCSKPIGNLKFQIKWVENYNHLEGVIRELDNATDGVV